jgi:hypothetical protein
MGWAMHIDINDAIKIENQHDKEVYHGDIGYVEDVEPDNGELRFDGRSVTYGFGELDAWCRPTPRSSASAASSVQWAAICERRNLLGCQASSCSASQVTAPQNPSVGGLALALFKGAA